jgi:regulator of sigma E protease
VSGSPAEEAGLRPGDRIVALNGEPVHFWEQMVRLIQASEGTPLTVRWSRPDSTAGGTAREAAAADAGGLPAPARAADGGRLYEAQLVPRKDPDTGVYMVGIQSPTADMIGKEFGVRYEKFGPGAALAAGVGETWTTIKTTVLSFQRLFTGQESVRENLGGPIAIAKVTKQAATDGAPNFWYTVALLSITLAIVNILPIPALDGGHLVFLLYEGITRREPSLKVRMVLQQVGMFMLLALMVFLIFNDIMRL